MKCWILNFLAVVVGRTWGCGIFETEHRDLVTFQKLDWVQDVVPDYPATVQYLKNAAFVGTPEVIADFLSGIRIGVTFKNDTGVYDIQVRVPWRTSRELLDECGGKKAHPSSINQYGKLDGQSHYRLLLGQKP